MGIGYETMPTKQEVTLSQKTRCYASNLTENQWKILKPLSPLDQKGRGPT